MEHNRGRLWVVTEYFYPDETATAYILTNVANKMSEKYSVSVICGPISDHIPSISSLNPDIEVHRTNIFNVSKDKLLLRALRFICIGLSLTFKLLWFARKDDKVLIVTNPAPLVIFVSIVKMIRQFELTILVHDVFPENAVSAGVVKSNSFFYKYLKCLFDRAYSRAEKLIVLGRDMAEVMNRKISYYKNRVKIKIIANWADVDLIEPSIPYNHSKIVIQYAGNIGRVQGLKEFICHFRDADSKGAVFSLWGKGAIEKELKQYVKEHNLDNVEFNGAFMRSNQNEIVKQCDICLVTLGEGMYGLGVPSKTYNILAAGKPILYIGPKGSEVYYLVEENKLGFCFEPTDSAGIIKFLADLNEGHRKLFVEKGRKARELATSKYTKEHILKEFLNFI